MPSMFNKFPMSCFAISRNIVCSLMILVHVAAIRQGENRPRQFSKQLVLQVRGKSTRAPMKSTPSVIPPPPTRRFRKQRYGMKMFHKKFQDGPLMAAAAEILRMATCVSRSAGVRPSGDDLTCFVIPANRSSDAFMSRYEKRSSNNKPPKISEKPSVEMCVRKLVRNMYHSYHFVITDSYNSNTNRYVSGTFHLSEQDIWIEFYKHVVKLRDWKQRDISTHISDTCFLHTQSKNLQFSRSAYQVSYLP